MFSFFSGLVSKKNDFDREPDDADAGLVDTAPAFVPPAPLAQVASNVAATALAPLADVPSDAERALEAEIREHQRLAEERLAERRERERALEELRLEEQRAREERQREAERREAERREAERREAEQREAEQRERERENAVRHTWPATLLQHAEAMEYGDAARRNLISMIVELRDPKLDRVLHDALYEERADGLRPEVLAALRRAYHDESLRDTYERFARIGNEAEREIAGDGLLALDAGEV
jgi:Skp family chaperone for outer membrane proteins